MNGVVTKKHNKHLFPTFNVLIATIGRPTLQNMLNSLCSQLCCDDCLTVVFDGHTELPTQFDFSKFKCEIKLHYEAVALKYWGHGIRNKYASLLEKRDFVMHADDDDEYISNAFSIIRHEIGDFNTLYICKFCDVHNNIIPRVNIIKKYNIGTPSGIIPYELNKLGKWQYRYGGDGVFYEEIAKKASNIVFLNKVIYTVNKIKKAQAQAQEQEQAQPTNNIQIMKLTNSLKYTHIFKKMFLIK